ncbi:MAG TPA: hypothetical protein VFJ82_10295 [Longimicrobium sp.]|nr:hypothetical protein [Longimicrobium sp.]
MRPSSEKLAHALAERLGDVLPPPYTLGAAGFWIYVYAAAEFIGNDVSAQIVEDEGDEPLGELVERVSRAVLSGLQDVVVTHRTTWWPVDGEGGMAIPNTRADEYRLHLWFGGHEPGAVVTLRPIDLAELVE